MRNDGLIILRNDEFFWGLKSALKVKTGRFFFFENSEIWSGRIVMGELPRENYFESGEKWKDFSKWFHYNGQPARIEDEKSFQRGLIVMGDLPRWNEMSWRDDMIGFKAHYSRDGSSKERSKRDRTRRGTRAEKHTRKEIELENVLPERWRLKGALERRQS